MISDRAALLAANHAFYRAFRVGDLPAMEAAWAVRAPVACVHPGADVLSGRAAVVQSWRHILASGGIAEIQCEHAQAYVLGEAGFVTCHERLGEGVLIATNLFVLEDDEWRMVQHHAGPLRPPE